MCLSLEDRYGSQKVKWFGGAQQGIQGMCERAGLFRKRATSSIVMGEGGENDAKAGSLGTSIPWNTTQQQKETNY